MRKREQGKRGSRRVKKWRLLIKSAKPARERLKPLAIIHHSILVFVLRLFLARYLFSRTTFIPLPLNPPHQPSMIQLITHLRSENPLDFPISLLFELPITNVKTICVVQTVNFEARVSFHFGIFLNKRVKIGSKIRSTLC